MVPPLMAEELLVLAYDPDGLAHGRSAELEAALAAALLLELAADGAVVYRDGQLHTVRDAPRPTHPQLAAVLDDLDAEPPTPPAHTVLRLIPGLRLRLLHGLVDAGVLTDVPRRWLGVMTRNRFPELDETMRTEAIRKLRAFTDGTEHDRRTAALATAVLAAGRADTVWSDTERVTLEHRVESDEQHGWATEAVEAAARADVTRKLII